jgi:hypothetical protein
VDYSLFKVSEMVNPSRTPQPIRSAGAGFAGMGAAGPVFLDASGNPISSIESGQPYGFNVPGFSSVWLVLNKDGAQVYNAVFSVPMALHTAQDSEIGTWQAIAYDANTGQLIGSTTFQITAAGASTGTTSGLTAWLANLTTTEKAIGAAAIVFLLSRKKGRK